MSIKPKTSPDRMIFVDLTDMVDGYRAIDMLVLTNFLAAPREIASEPFGYKLIISALHDVGLHQATLHRHGDKTLELVAQFHNDIDWDMYEAAITTLQNYKAVKIIHSSFYNKRVIHLIIDINTVRCLLLQAHLFWSEFLSASEHMTQWTTHPYYDDMLGEMKLTNRLLTLIKHPDQRQVVTAAELVGCYSNFKETTFIGNVLMEFPQVQDE